MADRLTGIIHWIKTLRHSGPRRDGRFFETLKKSRTESVVRSIICTFGFLLPVLCCAEDLPDPTRPPVIIAIPETAGGGVADNHPTGLSSIIISKTRHAAIIDGETVELGGKHGDARLVEVNEGSVVLKGAQGRQVLTLFPGVRMVSRSKMKAKPQPAENKVQRGGQKSGSAAHKEEK